MTRKTRLLLLRLPLLALVGAVAPAQADVLVLDPGPTPYRAGQLLPDGTRIDIPTGTSLELVLPNGDTRRVSGPFKGTVASVTAGVKKDPAAWGRWLEQLARGKQSEHETGGVRGFKK